MDIGNLPYDRHLTERAQALRREMTPQERKLWYQYWSLNLMAHSIILSRANAAMQNALQFWKLMACRYYASRIGISELISRVYA